MFPVPTSTQHELLENLFLNNGNDFDKKKVLVKYQLLGFKHSHTALYTSLRWHRENNIQVDNSVR
jgi:hypothetical protein